MQAERVGRAAARCSRASGGVAGLDRGRRSHLPAVAEVDRWGETRGARRVVRSGGASKEKRSRASQGTLDTPVRLPPGVDDAWRDAIERLEADARHDIERTGVPRMKKDRSGWEDGTMGRWRRGVRDMKVLETCRAFRYVVDVGPVTRQSGRQCVSFRCNRHFVLHHTQPVGGWVSGRFGWSLAGHQNTETPKRWRGFLPIGHPTGASAPRCTWAPRDGGGGIPYVPSDRAALGGYSQGG